MVPVSGLMLSEAAWPSYSTTMRLIGSSVTWPAKEPSCSASFRYGRRRGASSTVTDGMLSALVTAPCSRKSDICSATCSATFSCASVDEAPRCGVVTTCGWLNSTLLVAGSSENTSTAAPPTWPLSSAARRSSSTIRPPRAQLTIRTPGRHLASESLLIMPRVCSVSGVCSEMKSARVRARPAPPSRRRGRARGRATGRDRRRSPSS